jgi:hypothetical protein
MVDGPFRRHVLDIRHSRLHRDDVSVDVTDMLPNRLREPRNGLSTSTPDGVVQRSPGLADPSRPTLGSATGQFRTQNGFDRTSIPDVALVNIQTVFREQPPEFFLKRLFSTVFCTILSGLWRLIVHYPGLPTKVGNPGLRCSTLSA